MHFFLSSFLPSPSPEWARLCVLLKCKSIPVSLWQKSVNWLLFFSKWCLLHFFLKPWFQYGCFETFMMIWEICRNLEKLKRLYWCPEPHTCNTKWTQIVHKAVCNTEVECLNKRLKHKVRSTALPLLCKAEVVCFHRSVWGYSWIL